MLTFFVLPQVWDIAGDAPKCVQEREMKLGRMHCAEGCPDAPFVVCMGGDKNSDNLKVLDVRESADGEQLAIAKEGVWKLGHTFTKPSTIFCSTIFVLARQYFTF